MIANCHSYTDGKFVTHFNLNKICKVKIIKMKLDEVLFIIKYIITIWFRLSNISNIPTNSSFINYKLFILAVSVNIW